MKVLVLNGPNLGRLGRRQPEIYGDTTYAELVELCVGWGRGLGLDVDVRQTNHEGELLDWLNQAADEATPVVLNAAAWSHYSYALFDACGQLTAPLVEVHISDPASRPEEFRHHSVVTPHAAREIVGQGIHGYRQALEFLAPEGAGSTSTRAFTHPGLGTPAQAWRGHDGWSSGEPMSWEGVRTLLLVAAHPDDESLGAGALVAGARAEGLDVHLVCCTDGEGSHPDSPTLSRQDLAARRRAEARSAAAALAIDDVHALGLPDGGLADHEAEVSAWLVDFLADCVGDGQDTAVVAPWRRDGHPDHEAAGRAAASVARRTGAQLWEYPIWFWHWAQPDDAPWTQWRTFTGGDEEWRAKRAAIAAHESQVAPLSDAPGDETLLRPDILEYFETGPEHFVVTAAADLTDEPWPAPDGSAGA